MSRKVILTAIEETKLRLAVAEDCTLGQIVLRFQSKYSADTIKLQLRIHGLKLAGSRGAPIEWPEADEKTLHQAWAEGCTAGQAVLRLGGRYSRNACIGKLKRKWELGFGRGLDGAARDAHTENNFSRRSAGGRVANTVAIARGSKPALPLKKPQPPRMTREQVSRLTEPEAIGPVGDFPNDSASSPKECRAIKGDPADGDWQCCGQPTMPGRSYCETHVAKFVDLTGAAGRAPRHALVSKGHQTKVYA